MNKLKLTSLVGAAALLATSISTNSFAGSIGVGLNATGAYVNTTGQETLKQSGVVTKAERHAVGLLPSGYIQYVLDNGVTFGWDMSPGKVSIGSKGATKEEAGDNYTSAQRTVRNEAKAKARDLHVVYVESPAWEAGGGLFVKGGVVKWIMNRECRRIQLPPSYQDKMCSIPNVGNENKLLFRFWVKR